MSTEDERTSIEIASDALEKSREEWGADEEVSKIITLVRTAKDEKLLRANIELELINYYKKLTAFNNK